ncbi:MAG: M1 family peptidase, partial [Bacteroidetes bacterium]
ETPTIIISQEEAIANEKEKTSKEKTWVFHAENVRDFAFASSRKFIWDAMGVDINGRTVMAMSYYPKEGNPLWEEYSTRAVATTLEVYSKHTIDYPYEKAISVHTDRIGMEYPMICFNGYRPHADGTYSDATKYGLISVVIHEVGHNFFPMIVNSDERQWTWMDEGLNTFMQYLAEQEFEENYPSRRGPAANIVPYMEGDVAGMMPIMTNSESILQFGNNAYGKPATALNILRETILGPELFDYAFKVYAERWAFKHPTPADFFRTMEDASAVDLDWFWRGWFYTTNHVDISITDFEAQKVEMENGSELHLVQLTFENQGGLVMPVILKFTLEDGTTVDLRMPAEIWLKSEQSFKKVFTFSQEVERVELDPNLETADTDRSDNYWPSQEKKGTFLSRMFGG